MEGESTDAAARERADRGIEHHVSKLVVTLDEHHLTHHRSHSHEPEQWRCSTRIYDGE
jgi:hypothetical protein